MIDEEEEASAIPEDVINETSIFSEYHSAYLILRRGRLWLTSRHFFTAFLRNFEIIELILSSLLSPMSSRVKSEAVESKMNFASDKSY